LATKTARTPPGYESPPLDTASFPSSFERRGPLNHTRPNVAVIISPDQPLIDTIEAASLNLLQGSYLQSDFLCELCEYLEAAL
jgi:hypothetical protein